MQIVGFLMRWLICYTGFPVVYLWNRIMIDTIGLVLTRADPGFLEGGSNPLRGGWFSTFFINFPMKLK